MSREVQSAVDQRWRLGGDHDWTYKKLSEVFRWFMKLPFKINDKAIYYELTIRLYRKPRSLAQNDLFHKLVDIICKETGNEPEDAKDALVGEMFGYEEYDFLGKTHYRRVSTTKLKVDDMSDLIEYTYKVAAELGISTCGQESNFWEQWADVWQPTPEEPGNE